MSAPAIRGINERLSETNACLKELNCEIKNYTKPRVIVQIRISNASLNLLNFEIANVGNSPAYDISCHFNPDIFYPKTSLQLSQLPVFNNLSILSPHEKIVFLFANAIEYL